MKKNHKDRYSDYEEVNNPLSFAIEEETIPTNLKIPHEIYDGMTNLYDHISCFQTSLDLYGAIEADKYRMFSTTFKGTT